MIDEGRIIERAADVKDMYEKAFSKKISLTKVKKVLR